MRGAAAEHVFNLLPEEWEGEEFGEIGADEGGATDHAAGDIAPVGTVQSVGNSRAMGSTPEANEAVLLPG